jgi:prepilin-type processing-associated H-X9-DG protein
MYSDDYKDILPGPVYTGQFYEYSSALKSSLVLYVRSYLSLPAPSSKVATAEVFLCPAFIPYASKAPKSAQKLCMIANANVSSTAPPLVPPFGYPEIAGSAALAPLKLSELANYGSPGAMFALSDADKQNSPQYDNPWYNQLSPGPLHGKSRNELYFDGHVDARLALQKQQ